MTYQVVVEYDGCHRGDVALPHASGTSEQCVAFIASHTPPRGGYEFGIRNEESGRMVSYMVPPYYGRRIRIHMEDCK